jgi:serine carboxypeptidase-like clade 2
VSYSRSTYLFIFTSANLKANTCNILQIGNAVINDETDERGMYDYFATHALVPDRVVSQIQKYCNFSPKAVNQSSECTAAINVVDPNIDDIDIYNIYAPICLSTNLTVLPKKASVSDNFSLLINKY